MKKLMSLLAIAVLIGSFGVCQAEDLEPMPNPPVIIEEPEPTSSTAGSITLTNGWNLVAMPVLPEKPYTVEQFIKEVESPIKPIPKPNKPIILEEVDRINEEVSVEEKNEKYLIKSYWKVALVAVYKNGRFERYPKEGVSYNMVPGEAYFVYAKYYSPLKFVAIGPNGEHKEWHPSTTVYVEGKPLDVPVSLNLNRGWNGASVFEGDLQRLSDELTEQAIKATKIAFWSAEKQEWEQYELPIAEPTETSPEIPYEDGHSYPLEYNRGNIEILRPIRADEGFFLLCNENGLYIPSLNMKPETPVPPFPPELPVEERVSYTGRIACVGQLFYTPETTPYRFQLILDDESGIPIKGINGDIENQIAKIAEAYDTRCYVEGVMKTLSYPYDASRKAEVLIVDRVLRLNIMLE